MSTQKLTTSARLKVIGLCLFCTVIPDTENRIIGNGAKWPQSLFLQELGSFFYVMVSREEMYWMEK